MADKNGKEIVNKESGRRLPEKVISLAREKGIDLIEEPELLEIIEKVNPEGRMPDEVYEIISEILIQVFRLKDKWKNS